MTVPATAVALDIKALTLPVGASTTVFPRLTPADSTDALTFASSNGKVVAVNKTTGVITAKGKGTATVTIKTTSGKAVALKVTVVQ